MSASRTRNRSRRIQPPEPLHRSAAARPGGSGSPTAARNTPGPVAGRRTHRSPATPRTIRVPPPRKPVRSSTAYLGERRGRVQDRRLPASSKVRLLPATAGNAAVQRRVEQSRPAVPVTTAAEVFRPPQRPRRPLNPVSLRPGCSRLRLGQGRPENRQRFHWRSPASAPVRVSVDARPGSGTHTPRPVNQGRPPAAAVYR